MKFTTVPKHYGLVIEPPKPEDFTFGSDRSLGAKFQGQPLQLDGDWTPFLPVAEPQDIHFETEGCTTFGTLHSLQTLKKQQFDNSDNLSDRFCIVASGTNPMGGNTAQVVAEFIRQNWDVFETEYPFDVPTLQEFYQKIPNKYYVLAESRGTQYDFGYEQVNLADVPEALKYSPVGMSVPAWYPDGNGLYYRPDGVSDCHWVMCYGMTPEGHYKIFDSYPPYEKVLRNDVKPAVRMGYYLKKKPVSEPAWSNWIQRVLAWFKTKLGSWKQ